MPMLLIDLELFEQATANGAEERFDGFGTTVGQDDGPAGTLVVPARGAKPIDDRMQRFGPPPPPPPPPPPRVLNRR